MSTHGGGPAFPVPGLQHDEDFNGMTLRDYFAAKALQGLVVGVENPNIATCAAIAYDLADAMLKAREIQP